MNRIVRNVIIVAAVALLDIASTMVGGKVRAFTGTISDAMCGAKHMGGGTPAECTRVCVGKGSKYSLVAGDKVYVLDTADKAVLATIDKRAGANVTVKGELDGETIHVTSISEAK